MSARVPTADPLAGAPGLESGGARIVTLADRPDLAASIPGVLGSRWPMFMLAGRPGHDADLTALAVQAPTHQLLLVDAADEVLGVGLSVPLEWDGTTAGLPAGWDGAVTASADLLARGGTPDAVSALSITLTPGATGRGYAAAMINALKQAAARAGAAALIAPVRPVLKTRYPLMPMDQYLTWRTEDGEVFDPWLRLHLGLGGTVLGIAYPSMTVTGSVGEWRDWVGIPFPGSGEYVIAGGLAPLIVDRDADIGVYREPNVWVVHRTES
jgi:GNAT superfamily N-acetyltransferase